VASRLSEKLGASYRLFEGHFVNAGLEFYQDRAETVAADPFKNGETEASYFNRAAYGEVLSENPVANITLGARYESHTQGGRSFVPRVGLARVIGDLHLKALYSRGFRTPSIENINLNGGILPEETTVAEFEAGYRLTESTYLTANVFHILLEKPIVYNFNSVTEEYLNFEKTGSRGIELEAKFRQRWGRATLGPISAGRPRPPSRSTRSPMTRPCTWPFPGTSFRPTAASRSPASGRA
jgi:outer membrane cobalamin receptor